MPSKHQDLGGYPDIDLGRTPKFLPCCQTSHPAYRATLKVSPSVLTATSTFQHSVSILRARSPVMAFSKDGSTLYVSNLTLYLPYAGAQKAIDSAWTLHVKGCTVPKTDVVIPQFPDFAGKPVNEAGFGLRESCVSERLTHA